MKKIIIFLVVATMLAVLTGCGAKATETVDPNAIVMDDVTKMMAGTLLLQTTDYPLDAEQESSLLLLWKGYNVVATSSTSADAEIKALQGQIKAVFTEEQLSAIEDMELTADNLTTKLNDIGIQMGGKSAEGTDVPSDMMQMPQDMGQMPGGEQGGSSQNRSGISSNRTGGGGMPGGMGGGGMPGGGMMGGGMMGGGQSSLTGETGSSSTLSQQATLMANSLSSLSSRTTNIMLLTVVIRYLQSEVNPGSGMPGGMPGGNMPGGTMPTGEPGTMPGNMPTGEAGNMPGGNMPGSNIPGGNMSTPEATDVAEATATPTP